MKSNSRSLLACTVCFLFLFDLALFAQSSQGTSGTGLTMPSSVPVPPFLPYGGTLLDSTGKPRAGVLGVTFSLYAEQQGGAPLWIDTQNVQLGEAGRYDVVLGAAGKSLPLDLFSAGQPRWLQAQISGEAEQPRVLLVSVPYALKAGNADTLGGKPLSAFMLTDGVQPQQLWKGNASKSPDDVFVSALSGTGSSGKVAKWVDNAGTLGDSIISEVGGTVGIGTTSPTNILSVNSSAAPGISQFRITANDQGALSAFTYAPDNSMFGFDVDYSIGFRARHTSAAMIYKNGGLLRFTGNSGLTVGNSFTQTDRMVLDLTSGYFGVGATSPQSRLHVLGGNIATSPDLMFSYDQFGNYRNGIANTFSSGSAAYNIMSFLVGNSSTQGATNVMSLNGAGNVGIGTFFPTSRLSVVGNMDVTGGNITGNGSGLTNISATQVTGNGSGITNVNAALLNGQPASAFATRGITYLGGCDTCSVLLDTDDQKTIYLNVVGDMTINSVTCFSDAGTPTINIQRDNGSGVADVLGGPLSCSTTGTTSGVGGAPSVVLSPLSLNHKLDFVMGTAGGVAKRVTVAIKATVN